MAFDSKASQSNSVDQSAARSPQVDFDSLLSQMIDAAEEDPTRMRGAVYEIARIKLHRAGLLSNPPISRPELRGLLLALETAIERVETQALQRDEQRAARLRHLLAADESQSLSQASALGSPARALVRGSPGTAAVAPVVEILDRPPEWIRVHRPLPATRTMAQEPPLVRLRPATAPLLRVAILVIVVAAGVILTPWIRETVRPVPSLPDAQPATAAQSDATPSPHAAPGAPAFPLPSVYGVYALDNGQLRQLESLPGNVPDPRVFMSAAISKPSSTVLPDGEAAFIVFRRDLTANAPDKIAIRVIAKVMRAITFDASGKPQAAPIDDTWTIRNVSYNFTVAPIGDNPEIILVRPEKPDFAFPAGRYALVLKGSAYDFTIAGSITEPDQCLERVAAVNGTFYSPCKAP